MNFLLDVTVDPEGIASTTNMISEIIYSNKEKVEEITWTMEQIMVVMYFFHINEDILVSTILLGAVYIETNREKRDI